MLELFTKTNYNERIANTKAKVTVEKVSQAPLWWASRSRILATSGGGTNPTPFQPFLFYIMRKIERQMNKVGDYQQIGESIIHLVNHKEHEQALIKNAYEHVQSFDKKFMASKTLAVYQQCLYAK